VILVVALGLLASLVLWGPAAGMKWLTRKGAELIFWKVILGAWAVGTVALLITGLTLLAAS